MSPQTDITFEPFTRPFDVSMSPPGSKSLTNRALILAALAEGKSRLTNVLFADDTRVMLDCLKRLAFDVAIDEPACSVTVQGRGDHQPHIAAESADLFCGNSGTSIRFLAALCTLGRGRFSLDGIPRMRQRPIGQLADMLRNLGARIRYLDQQGFPPIEILADHLPGGLLTFVAGQSSQYLSAVLQVAPYTRHEVRIDLQGRQTSWPYVAMTMRLMDVFGHTPHLIRDETGEPRQIIVPQGSYLATDYAIEPDASNATYFLAAAALHPGSRLTIAGLGKDSLQGDVGFAQVLQSMGADVTIERNSITVRGVRDLRGIDIDLLSMPDTAQTAAVTALFAQGPTTLRGLHTLRVKETDRIAALATELAKLGAKVEVVDDVMTIDPPRTIVSAAIDTYDDHRMAMSFSLAATKAPDITIKDAHCVNKTYPDFFRDLEKLRA